MHVHALTHVCMLGRGDVLVSVCISVMKYHDLKQVEEERVIWLILPHGSASLEGSQDRNSDWS